MVQSVPMLFLSDCRSMVEHIKKTGASTDEKRVAMDLADLRHGIDNGDIISWMPTRKMVADCLTKHLTLDEEIEAICELLRSGKMHFRYADDGSPRTLTVEQMRQEGVVNAGHLESTLAVPRENDSEDDASFGMRTGSRTAVRPSDTLWSQSLKPGLGLQPAKGIPISDVRQRSAIVADGSPVRISEDPQVLALFKTYRWRDSSEINPPRARTGGPPPRAGAHRCAQMQSEQICRAERRVNTWA